MKYVICVPDGCADEPLDELGGRTPLQAASMPTLNRLAASGWVGRAAVIPAGMDPGSDVGNMSILGYDPAQYHSGRAPIEAAALGLRIEPDQVAFRCNLVRTESGHPEMMRDFAGGHPDNALAAKAVAALDAELGAGRDGVTFHPGVQYRHVMIAPAELADATCVPPHDLTDQPVVEPVGVAAGRLGALMDASRDVLAHFHPELASNRIWLWGQGHQPQLPAFSSRTGLEGGIITAVDLVRGLGVLTGMELVEVPGATGWYDTDYAAKRDAALKGLEDGADLFVIHVEATDEAGHAGDVAAKVEALENWDRLILTDLVAGLDSMGEWRMLLLPDHPTPCARRTHTTDSVPYLLVGSDRSGPGGRYDEPSTAGCVDEAAHTLIDRLIAG